MGKISLKVKDWVKDHHKIYSLYKKYDFRNLTSPLRTLPDFLIIGGQKCGTTSLYDFLIHHPGVIPATKKEIFYFSNNYEQGIHWYSSHFPLLTQKKIQEKKVKHNVVTGESSPYYIFHPLAAKRIKNTIPGAKLIVILRNPIDRAYSHYNFSVYQKREDLTFEDAISKENERIEHEKNLNDQREKHEEFHFRYHSYLQRGHYAEQLERWLQEFTRNQFLIITTEELKNSQNKTMNKIFEFLNLPEYDLPTISNQNVGNYSRMRQDTRKFLIDYFKPHNKKLYSLLNRNFDWDK